MDTNLLNETLDELRKRMLNGEHVKFKYMKNDGTVREAVGTLDSELVESMTKGTGNKHQSEDVFTYIDLDKNAWRSFNKYNFIAIL